MIDCSLNSNSEEEESNDFYQFLGVDQTHIDDALGNHNFEKLDEIIIKITTCNNKLAQLELELEL